MQKKWISGLTDACLLADMQKALCEDADALGREVACEMTFNLAKHLLTLCS